LTEEQKDRMNKFRNFLIQDAKNISTQDLLQNIANVISTTYTEEADEERTTAIAGIKVKSGNNTFMNNFFNTTNSENDPSAIENNRVVSGDIRPQEKQPQETTKKYP
jgi:hypothetical protein